MKVWSNNWSLVAQRYANLSEFREAWFYTVHNKYFLILTEIGILGLLAYLGFIFSVLYAGWRAWNSDDRVLAALALGLTAAIFGQLFHMCVDIFNSRPQVLMFCLVAALVFAIEQIVTRQVRPEVQARS